MPRPDDRPLRRLPQLEARKSTLERCVFCPKLCRSACPVSNAEERETLTPWGKMSMAYFVANESVEANADFAAPAWACTGCFGCRESCDHKNDVAGTLFAARSALAAEGLAPEGARRVLTEWSAIDAEATESARKLGGDPNVDPGSKTALLVGCSYTRRAPDVAADAIRAVAALTGGPVALIDVCCGAPLLHAGDEARFRGQGAKLAHALEGKERVIVVDAGCASTLRIHHPATGRSMPVPVEHFVELAARNLDELAALDETDAIRAGDAPVRWHDPCQLGRGLGLYDEPRSVLGKLLGRAPEEFTRTREGAGCSGAGGLLPLTMPDVSRAITTSRVHDHEERGGGTVVTACASSGRSFERAGATSVDLVSLVARALRR